LAIGKSFAQPPAATGLTADLKPNGKPMPNPYACLGCLLMIISTVIVYGGAFWLMLR
jgi:hypothetical protein